MAEELVAPEILTVRIIDASHVIGLQPLDINNVDMKFYLEGFNVSQIIDNDYTTHYTEATYQRERGFRATFDQVYDMDYVAFVPRLDSHLNHYKGTRKYHEYPFWYSIRVWETLDSEPKLLVNHEVISNCGKDVLMILPFEKSKVAKKKIDVFLYEWNGGRSHECF